jgi:signal transduction histidine kinase
VTGLAVLFTSAVVVCETSAFALAALCPMVFLTLQNVRAVLVVSGLSAVPLVIVTLRTGSLTRLQYMVPSTVLSLTFAVLAGTYIDKIARQNEERARMIAELRQRRAEIARLSHTAGVADERARMASEIHDTLAQGFTSIITLLQAAELRVVRDPGEAVRYLSMATWTARDNLAEARGLVAALTPPGLRAETLADAVRRLAGRLAEEKGIEVTADVGGAPDRLGTAVEVVILRTLQEGLANIGKHAEARTVSVELTELGSSVLLVLIDDGAGFDPAAPGRGFGLPGMRKRAEQVDGVLTIRSATGCGTILELEVPR